MNLVVFKNVFLTLEKKEILKKVSLTVKNNELTTIIGPNGGGKSSLAKLILGILKPTAGRVFVRKGLKIGYMPQKIDIAPFMPLTVRRFLTRPELLSKVGCAEIIDADMCSLSGGQMQRVLLAQALAGEPELLILDEPTQGLDVMGEALFYELILEYRKKTNCSILLISHDLNFVLKQTERVICLNGHICCQGVPTELSLEIENLFSKAPYIHHHAPENLLTGGKS